VIGILLAAGASRRLGRPKQTLPFGDTSLLGWTLRHVEASSLDRVVLVLGAAADEITAGLAVGRAEVVHNDAHETGSASSLQAGLDAAGDDADAVMILLGDMPGVDAAAIDEVRRSWEQDQPWAAMTSYRDARGHPLVLSAAAFPALRELRGDGAVWKLLASHPDAVAAIPVDRDLPPDIDTWTDYQAALPDPYSRVRTL